MLTSLPVEIIVHLCSYFRDDDLISLALVDSRLLAFLSERKRSLELRSCYSLNVGSVQRYLHSPAGLSIHQLDVSHCYWIDPQVLTETVCCLAHLQALSVQGTRLTTINLKRIFKSCPALVRLSTSLSGSDSSFWKYLPDQDADLDDYLALSALSDVSRNLAALSHLRLYGDCSSHVVISVFLCFCRGLQRLHLEVNSRHQASFAENISIGHLVRLLGRAQPPCEALDSFTCLFIGARENGALARLLCAVLLRKTCRLKRLWVPLLGFESINPRCLSQMDALRVVSCSSVLAQWQRLTSLHTNAPAHQLIEKCPALKAISCTYDASQGFGEFALMHSGLQALQLNMAENNVLQAGTFLDGFQHLCLLHSLSIDPRLLPDDNQLAYEIFNQITSNCSQLHEIELANWTDVVKYRRRVSARCLSLLTNCCRLKSLTLADIDVDDGSFISSILVACRKLVSLRITNMEMVTKHLIASLSEAKCLRDFRLQTTFGDGVAELWETLHRCESVQRVALIVQGAGEGAICKLQSLSWPLLVAACLVLPETTCHPEYIKSCQPAFQSCCVVSLKEASVLPDIHFNELVAFDSRICAMPS